MSYEYKRSSRYEMSKDWEKCTLSGMTILGDCVIVDVGVGTSTLLTPVIDCSSSVNAFGGFTRDVSSFGQTIKFYLKTSETGASWSDWEEMISDGRPPFRAPIRRYIQIKCEASQHITISPIINSFELVWYKEG